jgi:hypothetical protein
MGGTEGKDNEEHLEEINLTVDEVSQEPVKKSAKYPDIFETSGDPTPFEYPSGY